MHSLLAINDDESGEAVTHADQSVLRPHPQQLKPGFRHQNPSPPCVKKPICPVNAA